MQEEWFVSCEKTLIWFGLILFGSHNESVLQQLTENEK